MIGFLLQREHFDFVDPRGRRRFAHAVARGGKSTCGGPMSEENHILGIRGECPVYLWLKPVEWHNISGPYDGKLPDFAGFIDVKTVTGPRDRLIVRPHEPPDWAYLLVDASKHPYYQIIGWLRGHEAMKEPLSDPTGERDPAHFVPRGKLCDPLMLVPWVRKAQLQQSQS